MAPAPEVLLATVYAQRYNRLRVAAGVSVGRAWDGLAGLDDAAADRFADVAADLSLAAQAQTAAAIDGYLATMLGLVEGEGSVVGLDPGAVTGSAVRNGTEPIDVYRRGIVAARVAVSEGHGFADAMSIGRGRVVSAAETDVALTQRAAMVETAGRSSGIVGYRRVLSGQSCALCATASTQRYHTDVLMPIHNHCDCGVSPIIGDKDPGQVINKPLLADLKRADTGDAAYWRSRRLTVAEDGTVSLPTIAVREHGELGPVLADAADDFTGPDDLAA